MLEKGLACVPENASIALPGIKIGNCTSGPCNFLGFYFWSYCLFGCHSSSLINVRLGRFSVGFVKFPLEIFRKLLSQHGNHSEQIMLYSSYFQGLINFSLLVGPK